MGQPETMNTEIITLIGIAVALLGVQVLLFRWLRQNLQVLPAAQLMWIVLIPFVLGSTLEASEAATEADDLDIAFRKQVIGTVEGLHVEAAANDSSNLMVRLVARFTSLTGVLDDALRAQNNFLKRCSRRLYWVGNTSIRHYGGSLGLSSRVRYEQWVCGLFGDHRLLRNTKTVEWRLFVEPAPLNNISISAQVTNVRSLQNDLERLLGLRVRDNIAIPLPTDCGACDCEQLSAALRPEIESLRFEDAGNGAVRMVLMFSVASDLTDVLKCIGQ